MRWTVRPAKSSDFAACLAFFDRVAQGHPTFTHDAFFEHLGECIEHSLAVCAIENGAVTGLFTLSQNASSLRFFAVDPKYRDSYTANQLLCELGARFPSRLDRVVLADGGQGLHPALHVCV